MSGLRSQAWVTSVISDEDVPNVLMLCYSLRRTFTTKKIAVIASAKIYLKYRQALDDGFDFVFHLDKDRNTSGLKEEDFAKVYSLLALRAFETCAYLSPSLLALKNCDEIFAGKVEGFRFLENPEDTSIFLLKPSKDKFEALSNCLGNWNMNGTPLGIPLNKWASNQNKTSEVVPKKFNRVLTKDTWPLGYEKDMSMVNLVNYPKENDISILANAGILGKLVAIYWLKIYRENVLPLVTSSAPLPALIAPPRLTPSYVKEPIAIVGMSCRCPGSNNLEEFWELLFQGQDGTCNPPPFRWLREQCSRQYADARKTNAGFLKVPVARLQKNPNVLRAKG